MPHLFSAVFKKTEVYLQDKVPTGFVNNRKGQTLCFGVWEKHTILENSDCDLSVLSPRCQSQPMCLGVFCNVCVINAFFLVLEYSCVSQTRGLQGSFCSLFFFHFFFFTTDVLNIVTCKTGIHKISLLQLACHRHDTFMPQTRYILI